MEEDKNTTIEEMKMFVTGLDNNFKAGLSCDPNKPHQPEPPRLLGSVEGISFCHFEDVDVVRHHLVQRIVRAYDSYGKAQQQLSLPIGDAVLSGAPMAAGESSKV